MEILFWLRIIITDDGNLILITNNQTFLFVTDNYYQHRKMLFWLHSIIVNCR